MQQCLRKCRTGAVLSKVCSSVGGGGARGLEAPPSPVPGAGSGAHTCVLPVRAEWPKFFLGQNLTCDSSPFERLVVTLACVVCDNLTICANNLFIKWSTHFLESFLFAIACGFSTLWCSMWCKAEIAGFAICSIKNIPFSLLFKISISVLWPKNYHPIIDLG